MSDIFISYASANREWAKKFADLLEQQGWSVWWDRSIPAGKTFDSVIEKELQRSRCVVALWSEASAQSDWVKTEAAEGARRKILVPAIIEQVEIPLEFRRIQAADLSHWKGDPGSTEFRALCASIAQCLGMDTPPPRPVRTRAPLRLAFAGIAIAIVVGGIVFLLKRHETQERGLARDLAAASIATLKTVLDQGEASDLDWPFFLSDEGGDDLLQRSVLLAAESLRRTRSAEGEDALRRGLGFLVRPSRVLEHGDDVNALVRSANGAHLASASDDSTARVWETASGREVTRVRAGGRVQRVAFSPDGQVLATASADKTVSIWDALTGRRAFALAHGNGVIDMAFSRNGALLATASHEEKSARVWDLRTGEQVILLVHDKPVEGVLFDGNAKHVITRLDSAYKGPVLVWESRNGKLVQQLHHDDAAVQGFALSPDGTRLATSARGKVRVYSSGQWEEVISAESDTLKGALAFSADGEKLAVGSRGRFGSIEIVSASTGVLKLVAERKGGVAFVALSPDARHVLSVHQGQTASVWETDGGRELIRVSTSDVAHNSRAPATFSPDGRFLIAIGKSSVNYWPVFPAVLPEEACHRLMRNLTQTEWKAFLPGESYRKTCPALP